MNDTLAYLDSTDELLSFRLARERIVRSPKLQINRTYRIRIDRTMPFEFVAKLVQPFCGLWGAKMQFEYSDYDAALSQIGGDFQTDACLLWLDWRLYSKSMTPQAAVDWLMERIGHLRGGLGGAIFVNNWPESMKDGDSLFSFRVTTTGHGWVRKLNECLMDRIQNSSGCEIIDLAGLANARDIAFFDERNDAISSYPFSDQATIIMARHLGVQLFPAVFAPRLKAIALDLDDTLYRGVLGEDGISGLTLTEGHRALQSLLLRLKHSGMLLTICSRNEEKDVKALLTSRDDFPLKWNDFAAVSANWQPKAENLIQLAQVVNIDPSAFLFIDDNAAELLKMASVLPEVRLLRAEPDGRATMNKMCYYPGLYQLHPDDVASSRTQDIQANQRRAQIRERITDYNQYLESLKMVLRIQFNESGHAGRLFDLSHKTNQFNLALRRMTEMEAQAAMNEENYVTLTVHLADVLSESGIIGAFVCRVEGRRARVIETVFSCRALGREVETLSFACLLKELARRRVDEVSIDVREGPRNAPARDWLKRFVPSSAELLSLPSLLTAVESASMDHPAFVEVIK